MKIVLVSLQIGSQPSVSNYEASCVDNQTTDMLLLSRRQYFNTSISRYRSYARMKYHFQVVHHMTFSCVQIASRSCDIILFASQSKTPDSSRSLAPDQFPYVLCQHRISWSRLRKAIMRGTVDACQRICWSSRRDLTARHNARTSSSSYQSRCPQEDQYELAWNR